MRFSCKCVCVCSCVYAREKERQKSAFDEKENGRGNRGCGVKSETTVGLLALSNLRAQSAEWREMPAARPRLGGMKMSRCDYGLHNTPMSLAELLESGLAFEATMCRGPSELCGLN